MVELVLEQHDDAGDFAGDRDGPGYARKNSQAARGGVLTVRRPPFLGDVWLGCGLIVGHAWHSPISFWTARQSDRRRVHDQACCKMGPNPQPAEATLRVPLSRRCRKVSAGEWRDG